MTQLLKTLKNLQHKEFNSLIKALNNYNKEEIEEEEEDKFNLHLKKKAMSDTKIILNKE